jgi:putative endonuclease
VAARYLKKQGYRILARNYRCAAGEIDLIAAKGDAIVFVEVKTRMASDSDDGTNPVHPRQQIRIERAARFFLGSAQIHNRSYRFDVVLVLHRETGGLQVEHVVDAFAARGA